MWKAPNDRIQIYLYFLPSCRLLNVSNCDCYDNYTLSQTHSFHVSWHRRGALAQNQGGSATAGLYPQIVTTAVVYEYTVRRRQ